MSYDANDRPVVFAIQDGRTTITCGYDYRGRRFEKKVVINGAISSHARFLYRDYLQVARLDLTHPDPLLVKTYLWDPTVRTATRVLMTTRWKRGVTTEENFYFMHDARKNVTSIFDGQRTRRARYEYAPFGGLLTAEGDMARENKFRFSCEFSDDELGLVYYNYRHLNPADGRWINRDPIREQGGWNLYGFIKNHVQTTIDFLGMVSSSPLDPAFTPPPIPDRVGQSRGIKLSYFACKRKLDKLGDKAIKALLTGKVTHIPSDFKPNSECEESCQCIRSLTIIMHGEEPWIRKNDINVRAHWGERFLTENANKTEISDMFKKINFCSSCKLEIRACYSGSSPYLKKRLEQNTGCEVTLYEGQVKAFFPFFNLNSKNENNNKNFYFHHRWANYSYLH